LISTADSFRGQEPLRRLLGRYLAQGKLAGTLLLLGQRGLGKTTLATVIARALCCEQNQRKAQGAGRKAQGTEGGLALEESKPETGFLPPSGDSAALLAPCALRLAPSLWFCGECYACRSIASGNQPEYVLVRPKGQDIKAEQFDEDMGGLRTASLHPVHLPRRIFVLDEAHFLNTTTANQLLKLLEEPPAGTVFILCTDQPDKLLPTIRSRGVPFTLAPLPRWQLEEFLREDAPEADAAAVGEAAYLAGGRYVDALALAGNAPWRAALTVLAAALAHGRDVPERAGAAAEFEFAALWAKELADTGLDPDEAEKLTEKARVNELKRQGLALAYDRAAWWWLHEAARGLEYGAEGTPRDEMRGGASADAAAHGLTADRRGPAPSLPARAFAARLALLKQRIHSNVDPQLAQAAFEAAL
jgi:DNA polymerase III delta prime subunit